MFSQKMPSRSCFVVLFAAVICLCVLRSAEGQAKLCALAGGYDVNTLRSVPYWSVRFDSKDICGHVPPGTIKNCEIYLSFCQILPISETDPAGFCRVVGEETHLPKNTSACMVLNGTLDNDTTTTFGTYNPNEQPFQALDIVNGQTGFESVFFGGKALLPSCDETITNVRFRCDPKANWSIANDQNVTKYLSNAHFSFLDKCTFFLEFKYQGACVDVPGPSVPTSAPGTDPGVVGFVLILLFIVAVVTYLVVGSVINLALGKRSATDVFPNYAFWVGFPHLLLDGVRFSFNLVTCFYFYKTATPLSSKGKSRGQYETLPE